MARLFCIWLTAVVLATPGGLESAEPAPRVLGLEGDGVYQSGLRALQDELPDLAIGRFEDALARFEEDESARQTLHLQLGEASVRAARMARDPDARRALAEAALAHLGRPELADDERALFWSAQAAVVRGRFKEAAEIFGRLEEAGNESLRQMASMARVRILAALGRDEEAGVLLGKLEKNPEAGLADQARLLHASLELRQGNLEGTAALLAENLTPEDPAAARYQRYLQARLALAGEEFENAAALFAALAEDPRHLTKELYHGAILGRADALYALGRTDEATEVLLGFLDKHPATPLLDEAFQRLDLWALDSETLRTRYEERLQAWSDTPPLSAYREEGPADQPRDLRESGDVVALAAGAAPTPRTEIEAYALYHYALILIGKNDPESVDLARFLLARLRLEHPAHRLALASLLETAWLHNARGRSAEALTALEVLERLSASPSERAAAAKLAGYIRFKDGDFANAAEAFARARAGMDTDQATLMEQNQAVSLLRAGHEEDFASLFATMDDEDSKVALGLERTLQQAAAGRDVRPDLDRFLREHGSHPRINEARLAMAELAVAADPPDLGPVRALLDATDPAGLSNQLALRHLLARFRVAELTGDWAGAISESNRYLAKRKAAELAPGIQLKLAEAYYHNGDYNKARLLFMQIAEREDPAERLREVALFFASKAALKVLTEKSRQEAIALLRQVVDGGGVLANEARLHLARALIEVDPEEALKVLAPLIPEEAPTPEHVDALVLAAEAHRALGGPEHYRRAVAIYDRVLAGKSLPYALSNRFHSLRGQAYELLDEPRKALDSYFRVINRENLVKDDPVIEWDWYNDCGFNALRLLEADRRWLSAYRTARKLAAEKGNPRAGEARERARALQLEHMIWDDR